MYEELNASSKKTNASLSLDYQTLKSQIEGLSESLQAEKRKASQFCMKTLTYI